MSPPDDAARAERLAAALRENLKRRKAQAKGRVATPVADRGEGADIVEAALDGHSPGSRESGEEPSR